MTIAERSGSVIGDRAISGPHTMIHTARGRIGRLLDRHGQVPARSGDGTGPRRARLHSRG